ncbi:MAG: hypothetical protein IIW75_03560, partial [Bacteroidaceae bacterium]|nr:hypothetical protein [Bacteroidaceae bacterium]
VKPGAALRYLRHIQEATAVDAVVTGDADMLVDMSAVLGFVPEKFRDIYSSEMVKRLYDEGKSFCRSYDVTSFPTFVLMYRGEEMMLRGYSTYDILCSSIEQLSYGGVKPVDDGRGEFTPANLLRFMEWCGAAYPVEIATAFGLEKCTGHTALNVESYKGLPDMIEKLVDAGEVAVMPRGNGFLCYKLNGREPKPHVLDHRYADA